MDRLRVLKDDQLGVVIEADPELFARDPAILQKPRLELRVGPRARYDLAAQCRVSRVEHLDLPADFIGAKKLPLNHEFAKCGLHDLEIAGLGLVNDWGMIMVVVMIVCMRSHIQILSSHVSKTSMRRLS